MLNLDTAQKHGKLDQFAKERPFKADARFWPLLDAMVTGSLEAEETSAQEAYGDCTETQTRPGTSQDVED